MVLVCKFSKLVSFTATAAPTSTAAAAAIMSWCSHFGTPTWLNTDGGSHFRNCVIEDLTATYGMNYHITTPYCPWANGSAERMCGELLRTLRKLVSEYKLNFTDWPVLLPVAEFTLNHLSRRCLRNAQTKCPIEVVTGYSPRSPSSRVFWKGHKLADATRHGSNQQILEKHMDKLRQTIDVAHTQI